MQMMNIQTQAQNVACLGHLFGFSWLKSAFSKLCVPTLAALQLFFSY